MVRFVASRLKVEREKLKCKTIKKIKLMKKNFLKHGFAAAFALVAGYGVYASQQKVEMSDLAIANVEALANGESGTNTTWSCKGSANKCHAKCGLCGTEIGPSKGTLTGSHSCSL